MKSIVLLGSTGSVGRNVLDVVRMYPSRFRIKGLSSFDNVDLLLEQAGEFMSELAVSVSERVYPDLKRGVPRGTVTDSGEDGLIRLADLDADIIFVAISGTAALRPLAQALGRKGNTVALASKEPVVSAGSLLRRIQKASGARILPVDSEHCAVMQCMEGKAPADVRTLYITGSGGSLKDIEASGFRDLSVERVLAHPTWQMGPKITVDSATLMNKGLEVIEARWLFGVPEDRIKVVIHPQSIVHSVVEFTDGTMNANLFRPDMRFPILKALSYPEVLESDLPRVDLVGAGHLSFEDPDRDKFPALDLAYGALRRGGTMPAALNASNEEAVTAFLEGVIAFPEIIDVVREVLEGHRTIDDPGLEDIYSAEEDARKEASMIIGRRQNRR